MKISVLLPTRNRLFLLKYAVESVRRQDYEDWEIVVSDNDSTEDVGGYVNSLDDPRIRYFRTDRFLPVTDNWNNALSKSRGDYVVMLGDDDCLMRGYFRTVNRLVEENNQPDFAYTSAFLYAYPGVLPDHPEGFLRTYGYPAMFGSAREPFILERGKALNLVRESMRFRLLFGYNMQYSLVSRTFIDRMAEKGPFFQSPFPDYYATNAMLLSADKVLVCPLPLVTIGISPRSFGYYYFNRKEEQGIEFLKNMHSGDTLRHLEKIILPGTGMNTFWLMAMEAVRTNYGKDLGLDVDYGRYRLLQIVNGYGEYIKNRNNQPLREEAKKYFRILRESMRPWEKLVYGIPLRIAHAALGIMPSTATIGIRRSLLGLFGQYPEFESRKTQRTYANILEVFENVDPFAPSTSINFRPHER